MWPERSGAALMRRTAVAGHLPAGATRRPLGRRSANPTLRDWLLHADSLTARIRSRSACFAVRVMFEGPVQPDRLERRAGLGSRGLHGREVLLLADGVPVVWARTVLARRSLRGPWHFLRQLGTRPLGARLFTDVRIRRDPFVYPARGPLLGQARRVTAVAATAMAPRSARLVRCGQLAVLTEVLLPGVLQLQTAQSV